MAEDHPADDVMPMAYRAIQPWMGLNDKMAAHDCATAVAKVIIEYGEQRARDAIEELRKTCADIWEQDASWPAHGNAPLAIAAALQLRVTAAREVRRKVFEEIDQEDDYRIGDEDALRFGEVALPWRLLDEARAEIARLGRWHDDEMERVKACEHIAEGDEGWEVLRNLCPSTAAVATLRDAYDKLREYGDQRAREARAAGIEAAARLCDDAAAQAKDLRDQQERRTPSQSVDRNITRLGVRIVAATELGRSIRGLAGASPQSEADRLERDHILYAEGRAAGLEAAAHAADQYIEHPTSGQHNNTQAAFDQGMDHYAGCVDSALAIAQAIRALATAQGGEG